jgi:transposase
MTKPLSLDLRRRIIRAVEEEGMSRRAAAARFGVVPSTAVELVRQWKATGSCEARPQGGDRRSGRIEAHAGEILALVKAEPDITLEEIASQLFEAHGERFVPSVLWRFFDRRAVTFKKNGARQRAGTPGRGRAAGRLAGRSA